MDCIRAQVYVHFVWCDQIVIKFHIENTYAKKVFYKYISLQYNPTHNQIFRKK